MQESKEQKNPENVDTPVDDRNINNILNLETDDKKREILFSINDEMNELHSEIDDKLNKIFELSQERDQALLERDKAKYELKEARSNNYIDNLTGCFNQNYFEKKYKNDNAESFDTEHDRKKIALVYIDINGLKYFNDKFGHDKGDELIVAAAKFFVSKFREEDTVIRLHGDEFVVVCRDRKGIDEVALRNRVSEIMRLSQENDTPFSFAAGVAVFDKKLHDGVMDFDLKDTEKRADSRMYEIKEATKLESMTTRKRIVDKIAAFILRKEL